MKQSDFAGMEASVEELTTELVLRQRQFVSITMRWEERKGACAELRKSVAELQARLSDQYSTNLALCQRVEKDTQEIADLALSMAQNQSAVALADLEKSVLAEQVAQLHGATKGQDATLDPEMVILDYRVGLEDVLAGAHESKETTELHLDAVVQERSILEKSCSQLLNRRDQLINMCKDLTVALEQWQVKP